MKLKLFGDFNEFDDMDPHTNKSREEMLDSDALNAADDGFLLGFEEAYEE